MIEQISFAKNYGVTHIDTLLQVQFIKSIFSPNKWSQFLFGEFHLFILNVNVVLPLCITLLNGCTVWTYIYTYTYGCTVLYMHIQYVCTHYSYMGTKD